MMDKKEKLIKECEYCGTNATCLCFEDLEYYCDFCFKNNHNKKLKENHKSVRIDPYVPIDLKCREHPKNPNNLFCVDEKGK